MEGHEQQPLMQTSMPFQNPSITTSQTSGMAGYPGSDMITSQGSRIRMYGGMDTSQISDIHVSTSQISDMVASRIAGMATSQMSGLAASQISNMAASQIPDMRDVTTSRISEMGTAHISGMARSPNSAIKMAQNSSIAPSQPSAIGISEPSDAGMSNQEIEEDKPPAEESVQDGGDKSVSTDLPLVEVKEEMVKEKIKSHSSFLANGLFLLWTGEVYCDCILVVDIKELKCHSCVIASFSPVLQIKLNTTPQKTRLEDNRLFVVLDLTEVMSFADLEPLIKYMYTGELNFKRAQVYDILKSAQFLGLKEIQQFCFIWMSQNLTIAPTVVTFKSDIAEIGNVALSQKTSVETNSNGNVDEKDDEFNFQDYIDILNSWQRAVTEDSTANVTDSLSPSINMLKDMKESAAARIFTPQKDVKIPGRLEGGVKEEEQQEENPELKSELLDAELDELLGQRKRRSKRPIRFNAGEVVSQPRKMTSFDDYKPSDHIYVNFSNDRYLGSETFAPKGQKTERIIVVLPGVAGEGGRGKNSRKSMMPRKVVKKKYIKAKRNADGTIAGNGVVKPKRYKTKNHKDVVVTIAGESFTCVKSKDEENGTTLKCPTCSRFFKKLNLIREHMRNHKNNELTMCNVCGQGFLRPSDLTRHVRYHTDLKCKHCKFATKSPKMFILHSEQEHGITKPFICTHEGCKFATNRQHQLDNHRVIHSSIKPFRCTHCGKTFAHRGGLSSHLKSCLQKRNLLCDLCGKAFNHLGSLKAHRRVHSGDKPYKCTECTSRFSDHRNLKRHTLIHEKAYPYGCQLCEKRFRHTNSLKTHLRSQHKMNPQDIPRSDEMEAWKANMDVVLEAAERMACAATMATIPKTKPAPRQEPIDRETSLSMPIQAFSTNLKRPYGRPQSNLDSIQKLSKASNLDTVQTHQYLKRQDIAPLDQTPPPPPLPSQYSQLAAFQQNEPKLASPTTDPRRLPPAPLPGTDPARSLEYQPNISMAHAQPPMTSGYSAACLTPFSPFVPPELHSFYSSQGLIPGGHLEGHPHLGIAQSGGVRPPSAYPQLQDYSVANLWRSAHDDLHNQTSP